MIEAAKKEAMQRQQQKARAEAARAAAAATAAKAKAKAARAAEEAAAKAEEAVIDDFNKNYPEILKYAFNYTDKLPLPKKEESQPVSYLTRLSSGLWKAVEVLSTIDIKNPIECIERYKNQMVNSTVIQEYTYNFF